MLDPNLLRYQLNTVKKKLLRRGFVLDIEKIESMEKIRKKLQIKTEKLQEKNNILSKLIGQSKILQEDTQLLYQKVIIINKNLNIYKEKLNILQNKIKKIFLDIPNIPDDNIPNGKTEVCNQEIMKWGEIPKYNFIIKNHIDLGEQLNGFDLHASTVISGSRFIVMKGKIAYLHRALIQFMLDLHTNEHEYLETYVPYLVNQQSLFGTGQLPKFSKDLFHIESDNKNCKNNYVLIPTAEVPLTNIVRNKILNESELPLKFVAHSPCFRSESASYGKDVKGLIRLHQFDKIELVQIVKPEYSMKTLELLTLHAEKVLRLLELPYRKILLCCGDLGFASTKTYDLEVWFPAQNKYREISSCSNMLDFQSRRMKARYRNLNLKKNFLLHTVNGSGLAVGRTLAAILENYQCKDGKIKIPTILRKKYMNGLDYIE
ncbi:Serine--tRNA ligase [Buchnera aphidicola (Eriosoma grossulariae)]|uniref:serine--tRNA ligase n=1 Tax=Buchnera aphidicola TaxID=9 RepID=UPI003464828D